jgi:hypothetical protein
VKTSDWADIASSGVRRLIDGIFLLNPAATSFGAVVGVVLHALSLVFAPTLAKIQQIDMSRLEWYHFVAVGAALANIPALIEGRRELPKELEDALELIRRSESHLTRVQMRMQRLALCNDVIERVNMGAGDSSLTPRN